MSCEGKLSAQLSKFEGLGSSVTLSKVVAAFFLLGNADVDGAHRISILAAVCHKDITRPPNAFVNELVRSVKYEEIAPVTRRCDQPRSNHFENGYANASNDTSAPDLSAAHASTLNLTRSPDRTARSPRPHSRHPCLCMSSEEAHQPKRNTACTKCEKCGHRYANYSKDGSLNAQTRRDRIVKQFELPSGFSKRHYIIQLRRASL